MTIPRSSQRATPSANLPAPTVIITTYQLAALAFYATLFTDGVINRTDMTIGYGDGPGILASGKAAMFVDGDWRTGAYLTDKSTSTWGALCRRRLSNAPNMLWRGGSC